MLLLFLNFFKTYVFNPQLIKKNVNADTSLELALMCFLCILFKLKLAICKIWKR